MKKSSFNLGKLPPIRTGRWLCSFALAAFLAVASCNLPSGGGADLSGTKAALDAQGTQLAQQLDENARSTQVAFEVQATVVAQQAAQLTQMANPAVLGLAAEATPTSPPQPTDTPQATQTLAPTETLAPTQVPATPTPDLEAWMKDAKILLFEDITGIYLQRYIKDALDGMDLNYVDVKDAVGDFKSQLLSGTDWDLIITGVEARSGVKGEFFDYLNDQLNADRSVILEIWNLDEIGGGRISPLLTRCGVKVQADWWDPEGESRSVWWLIPEHPIFHEPNDGVSLAHYSIQWFGDAGDLLRQIPGSEATILAGTLAWEKDNHATLASCLGGKFLIQTHSSHDFRSEEMMRLWQNYIHFALKNHFAAAHSQ